MSEKNYVLNVKTKAGTIFTVRGDTYQEFLTNVNTAVDAAVEVPIATLESALLVSSPVATVMNAVGGTVIDATPTAQFAPVPPPVTPSAFNPLTGSAVKQCVHGEMTKREGSGQWGPYKAYYCPTPKGTADQCKPVYVKPNDPEWATF
jgi:hypothetical protein